MASIKFALVLALFAVGHASSCGVNVEVLYPASAGGAPTVSCTPDCDGDETKEATYMSCTAFKTFPELTERFDKMVSVEYENGAFKQCTIVPYQSEAELANQCESEETAVKESQDVYTYECSEGFSLIGESCFLVSPDKAKMNVGAAYCVSLGADAAIVESQEQMDQLAEFLTVSVYLATNDKETEGTFVNPGRDTVPYLNFNDGEPNNNRNEDCVLAKDNKEFRWNDVKCSKIFNILCQTPATAVIVPQPICQDGEQFDDSTCFLAAGPSFIGTFQQAADFCQDNGMVLASIRSQEEQDFVNGLVEGNTWIGITDRDDEGSFGWYDGYSEGFTNWFSSEPNDLHNNEDCGEMRLEMEYQWNDANCDDNDREFLCRGSTVLA